MSRTYRYDHNGILLRRYNLPSFPDGTNKKLRKYMNKKKRQSNKLLCRKAAIASHKDDPVWPVGNHKPQEFFW